MIIEGITIKKIVKIICECNLVYLKDKLNTINSLIEMKFHYMKKENNLENSDMIKRMLDAKY